ncbi:MAG: hypothetical protein M3256_03140 [Actinomycetota bacterium]|nr:hypothetical protein [Actinomycetota bacterium]
MIREIEQAIDAADVVVAEVGSLNQNVLYEAGYAIARKKRVWLLLDGTDETAVKNWKTFGLLSSIGYFDYQGDSEVLAAGFLNERPDLDARELLWNQLRRDFRFGVDPRTLFFFPTSLRGDAPRQVDRELSKRKNLAVLRADEDERGYAPISYYAEMIHRASASLVYMLGQQRTRASVHNARASLVAGMAAGLGRPLLILAEESFDPPIDYQDILYKFGSVRDVATKLNIWLDELPTQSVSTPARFHEALGLPLNLGEYVAEYEADSLEDYFVPTAEFARVLNVQGGTAVFVGRKGTGKTATMLQAAAELGRDKRNLVTVIKPTGYELESLLDVLKMLPDRGEADYFLNGLWEYLLHCEIAAAGVREAEGKPAGIASGSPMDALRAYLERYEIGLEQDLAVRLEGVVQELLEGLPAMPEGVGNVQQFLNQKLHASTLREMRRLTGEALGSRERVALLIDNLDKAWERGADYERLSRVVFGLLSAVGHVARDFARDNAWRSKVNVTLTVFLRADIFSMVLRHAREPDKIDILQIRWPDRQLLSRVIEDRYASVSDAPGEELWSRLFGAEINGMRTREYVLWRVLPRPRDLVYLCNASLMEATNNRHAVVDASDIAGGERAYSQFAFEALLVESDPEAGLADLLFDFAGRTATLTKGQLSSILHEDLRPDFDELIGTLLRSSFLGLEVDDEIYEYFTDETSEKKHRALALRLEEKRGNVARYRIHPAFRPFLEIDDDDLSILVSEDRLPLDAV